MGVIERLPDVARIDLAEEGEFEIGGMKVRPAERAVFLGDQRIELQPRVMQVLVALAQVRPDVVSRDRLIAQCWDGRVVGDDSLNRCILALRGLARRGSPEPFAVETVPRIGYRLVEEGARARSPVKRASKSKGWRLLALPAIPLAAILGGLFVWSQRGQAPQTVLVAAAADDEASKALARDLSAQLGSLQLDHATSMRLVSAAGAPDLIFRVASTGANGAGPSVILRDAGGAILWSKDFQPSWTRNADLRRQIAFATAQVLDCALEGKASPDRLSEQMFKTYLNACANLSHGNATRQTAQALEGVVKASPRFVAGWAGLLQAEVNALARAGVEDQGGRARLKRHIEEARRVEPDLAETYIAEAWLLPPNDFLAKDRALSTAVERNPNHGEARLMRAALYQSVGRNNDAVQNAREAVKLDPLSPSVRDGYIAALGAAGRTEAAFQVLDGAEKIWPGAPSLLEARYRLHLRSGDPREALGILRSGGIDTGGTDSQELFLRARIDPSKENIDRVLRWDGNVTKELPQAIVFHSQALAQFGRTDELLDILLDWDRPDLVDWVTNVLFRPAFAGVHRDPRFMKAADRLGLLHYWRSSGKWPDLCFAPELPYDCKAEAAKIAAGGSKAGK